MILVFPKGSMCGTHPSRKGTLFCTSEARLFGWFCKISSTSGKSSGSPSRRSGKASLMGPMISCLLSRSLWSAPSCKTRCTGGSPSTSAPHVSANAWACPTSMMPSSVPCTMSTGQLTVRIRLALSKRSKTKPMRLAPAIPAPTMSGIDEKAERVTRPATGKLEAKWIAGQPPMERPMTSTLSKGTSRASCTKSSTVSASSRSCLSEGAPEQMP
mmetsp:Transcript_72721/g.236149  ORF Transcript_72721/g.236149 Transcript_72721/m.236149 type:complete len:214 (+) Transcript_72721:170-811(+)